MTAGRVRSLILSYATAGLSKSVAAAVQFVALPVVAMSLGAERFGALLVLGATGAIFCMPARGIPPSLSYAIAHMRGRANTKDVASQIWGAAIVSMAMGAAALAIAAGLLTFGGMSFFLGTAAGTDSPDLDGAIAAFLLLIAATYGFSWVEGVRTGYEQHHINNMFSLLGSLLALLGIGLAWAFVPTLTAFFLAIYVAYPVAQLANLLLVRRSIPPDGDAPSMSVIRAIARRSFSWSTAQAGVVLNLHGTVWLAAQTAGLVAGGLVGAVVRVFQILGNLFLALLTPVLPTLSHSVASGDRSWSSRTLRFTTLPIAAALAAVAAVVSILGDDLLRLWLGLEVQSNPVLFAGFGLLAIAHLAPQLFYLLLMAMGAGRSAALNLLWGGVCGTIAGVIAMQFLGLPGLVWAQALGMFFVACLPNSYLIIRRLGSFR